MASRLPLCYSSVPLVLALSVCLLFALCGYAHGSRELLQGAWNKPATRIRSTARIGATAAITGAAGIHSFSERTTSASSITASQAGSVLASRLGLAGDNAQCATNAVAMAVSPAIMDGGQVQDSGNIISLSGEGLTGLAACGATSSAVAPLLTCSRFPVPAPGGPLCDLSGQLGSSCVGLKLINPGLERLTPGQAINIPPCTFGL